MTPRRPSTPSSNLIHIHATPRIRRHIRPARPIDTEQNIILTRTPQSRAINPRRLPIMDSLAQSPRHALQHADDVAHPLGLAGRRNGDGGVAEVQCGRGGGGGGADGGPVGFGDVHGLGVLGAEGGEGGVEVGEGGGGAVEGVERKAKDIPPFLLVCDH